MSPKEKRPVSEEAWDTPTGLPNDVDGYIHHPYFGFKKEYAEVAGTDSPMIIFPLVNEDGEEIGSQGFSCGAGWLVKDEGARIEHPLRSNIIKTSLYGQLIRRVKDVLKVRMEEYGSPLLAATWDGLGFHWKQEEHRTVSGDMKTGLMPVEFLGEREATAPAPAPVMAGVRYPLVDKLTTLAQSLDIKAFQRAALKIKEVLDDDELMSSVMDDGKSGFWATHQTK